MALNYSKKVMEHFLHPRNIGEMKDADGFAEVGNPVCGDQLSFYIKVKDGKIADVKFLSFGCASNIATASILTEEVKGMKVEDAKKYDWNKIVKDLGGLPKQKVHCSILAVDGLKKAIEDYQNKRK
jgi:nitrogen fixation NifU-like protein